MQFGLHAWVMESEAGGSPVAGGGAGAPAAPVAMDGMAVAMRMVAAEDTWKATTRVHRLHMTRMVENTLLYLLRKESVYLT